MKSLLKFLIFIIVVLALIFIPIIVYYISLVQERDRIKEQVLALSTIVKPIIATDNQLATIVNSNFGKYGTDYAVVVKNFKTGEEFRFNENRKYNSASLYKLWIMGLAYEKINDGSFKKDQILTGNQKILDDTLTTVSPTPVLNDSSQESGDEKVISLTLSEAINRMITYSDNYSALLIASKSGTFSVTNFLKKYGLYNSSFRSPPQTTANDVAIYYEKLYKGEIVNKEYSEIMLEILKQQTINDRIPKYLPKDTVVAHKTGELIGVKHDAGIVFNKKGDYMIVIMSDTKDPVAAAEKEANFSKEIFEYFN